MGTSRDARTASRSRFRFASYQLTPTRKQCDSSRRSARNATSEQDLRSGLGPEGGGGGGGFEAMEQPRERLAGGAG